MAQAGFTPISLYFSTTAAAVPSSANLVAGELALNTVDEKLYFKNSAGTVKLLASNATSAPVLSFQTSLGGLTPSTATTGVVTLAGTLNTTSGGTGLTSFTAGDVPYYASGSVLSKLAIGTAGQFLTSTGTAPQWSTLSGVAVTTFSAGTTGFTPNTATSGAITLAGTLGTANGGTNLGGATPFTANGVVYASSSSALATGSGLVFDGTAFGVGITPSAWVAGYSVLQVGKASWYTDGNGFIQFANNTYQGSGYVDRYIGSNYANKYEQSDAHKWYTAPSGTAGNAVTFSEQMRLTSTGLGIGTSSPSYKLSVSTPLTGTTVGSNIAVNIESQASGRDVEIRLGDTVNDSRRIGYLSGNLYFALGTTEQMRLDTSGNLGLGVTPSAWNTSYKAEEIGFVGNGLIGFNPSDFAMSSGAYYDSAGWKYSTTNSLGASFYEQYTGQHIWYNKAPTAHTAGDAISFTQAMTLTAAGSLGVGTTGPNAKLEVSIATLTSGEIARFSSPSYESVYIFAGLSNGIGTVSTSAFKLSTNSTARFEIGGSGQFGIGTVPDYGTSGQVLTSGGSAAAPTWTTVSGGSQWVTSGSNIYYTTGNVSIGTASVLSYGAGGSFKVLSIDAGTSTDALGFISLAGGGGGVDYNLGRINFGLSSNTTTAAAVISGVSSSAGGSTGGSMIFSTSPDISAGGVQVRLRIPAAGGVQAVTTISVGNATPSASGAGITFPATQDASTDANTLDDYEEGSFTGTLTGCTTSPTTTFYYVKVGRCVTLGVTTSATATSNSTACTVTGMPATIRPLVTNICGGARIRNNSADSFGMIAIDSAGVITLYHDVDANNFVASGQKGILGSTYSYHLNS